MAFPDQTYAINFQSSATAPEDLHVSRGGNKGAYPHGSVTETTLRESDRQRLGTDLRRLGQPTNEASGQNQSKAPLPDLVKQVLSVIPRIPASLRR
jgi:hypothetical protein